MGWGGDSVTQHEVRGFNNIPIQKTIMIRECFASELLELEKTFLKMKQTYLMVLFLKMWDTKVDRISRSVVEMGRN